MDNGDHHYFTPSHQFCLGQRPLPYASALNRTTNANALPDIGATSPKRRESDKKVRSLSSQRQKDCPQDQRADGGHGFNPPSTYN